MSATPTPCGRGSPYNPKNQKKKRGSIMAIFHLTVRRISRGKGQSAIASACYIENGKGMRDERLNKTFSFRLEDKPVYVQGSRLANGAYIDTAELWNKAERAENRKDALVARQIEFAFPYEFHEVQQNRAARELENWIHERYGAATTLAIHRNVGNPHAHLMFTTRAVSADGTFASQKLSVLSDRSTGRQEIKAIRAKWAEICNAKLPQGHKIDPRSYKEQGINRTPQIHLGPAVTAQIRKARAKGEPVPEYLMKAKIHRTCLEIRRAEVYHKRLELRERREQEFSKRRELQQAKEQETHGENQARKALRSEGRNEVPGGSGEPAPMATGVLREVGKNLPGAGKDQSPNHRRAAGRHGEVHQRFSGGRCQSSGFGGEENSVSGNRGEADSFGRSGRRFTPTDLIGQGGVNLLRAGIALKAALAERERIRDLEALHSARKTESQRLSQLRPGT